MILFIHFSTFPYASSIGGTRMYLENLGKRSYIISTIISSYSEQVSLYGEINPIFNIILNNDPY